MRRALPLLVLCLAWQHTFCKTDSSNKPDSAKTDKRALVEGNSGINKRAPLFAVTPGIEYAEAKETLSDKSPPQQVYATSAPQLAKISDVLTGHGPSFPTAIANHLYSPVPVYQSLGKEPTTVYQVSAPVPSQLAYSEHKIYYPGTAPRPIQYFNQPQPSQHTNIYQQPPTLARATALSYAPPHLQQSFLQPYYTNQQLPQLLYQNQVQPGVIYSQNDQSNPSNTQPQTFNQNQPSIAYDQPQSLQSQQYQQLIQTQQYQQPIQRQQVQQSYQIQQSQSPVYQPQTAIEKGVTYTQNLAPDSTQVISSHDTYIAPGIITKPAERDLKTQPIHVVDKGSDVDTEPINNEVKTQSQGAISFASFSLGTAQSSGPTPHATHTYLPASAKPPTVLPKAGPTNINYIPSGVKPNVGYAPVQQSIGQSIGQQGIGYYPQPNFYHSVPQQVFVQGPYQAQVPYQAPVYQHAQSNLATAPAFPAVQYFGKFAHSLFGGYTQ